mmetsp:Transcript_34384/g.78361  ORF Transcript_34384/g.78361 Transcript_34384/m.78361 type:complete len:241 (-) Transcript_34384:17-739(-)
MGCASGHSMPSQAAAEAPARSERWTSKSSLERSASKSSVGTGGMEKTPSKDSKDSKSSDSSGCENTSGTRIEAMKSKSGKSGNGNRTSRAQQYLRRISLGSTKQEQEATVTTRVVYSPRNTAGWISPSAVYNSEASAVPRVRRSCRDDRQPQSLGSSMVLSEARIQNAVNDDPDYATTKAYIEELNTYLQAIQDTPEKLERIVQSARENAPLFKAAPPLVEGGVSLAISRRELKSINLLL